jgi:hypothetical protein
MGLRERIVWPNAQVNPKLHRYANNMADKACHVVSYALQFGLNALLGAAN